MENLKEQKNRKKPLWHDWLLINVLAAVGLILLVLLVSVFVYGMRYPKIWLSQNVLLNGAILVMFLQLLNGVAGLNCRVNRYAESCRMFTRAAIPTLLAGLVSAVILLLLPPFCSSTTKLTDYMQFDRLPGTVETSIREIFPEQIPEVETEANYRYFKYASVLEESMQLSLSLQMTEAEMAEEFARIQALPYFHAADIRMEEGVTVVQAVLGDEQLAVHLSFDAAADRVFYTAGYRHAR